MGGNIGVPGLQLKPFGKEGIYVLEMSSYQLELMDDNFFDRGIFLNLSPDHLHYHGTMESYRSAKLKLFQNTKPGFMGIVQKGLVDAEFMFSADDRPSDLPDSFAKLPGAHNWENILSVYHCCKSLGLSSEEIIRGIDSFSGLAHRQEYVGKIGDIVIINDSKATNSDATAPALNAYNNIYWILGGQAKEGGIDNLMEHSSKICHAYLIGESQENFSKTLDGKIPYSKCMTLNIAFETALQDAQRYGGQCTLLLSPACASWDQFKSFEERGNVFKELAQKAGAL
jgi:UDP-N-acetylmuramoylalanine--D-glutamate ligase